MKIGIVTINDNNNYGNRLQNYAVQEVLKKKNHFVETILNEPYTNTREKFVLRLLKNIGYKGTYSTNEKRKKNFEEFNKKITFSSKRITAYSKCKQYDYVIVGSDQVWNPYFGRMREVDLLEFVEEQKRISFAASFGVTNIPENKKEYLKKAISNFKKISVREDAGKKIIEEISDRTDIEVVVDPTMLLLKEDWEKVLLKPKKEIESKYILLYFLGNISEERMNLINEFAVKNSFQIINILDKNGSFYDAGPSEFLYLIKNSEFVFTDSFHACVFSFLFEKLFVVFDREQNGIKSMNSRIKTFLNKFQLENRFFENEKTLDDYKEINYNQSNKLLENERNKAFKFLNEALEEM